MIHRRGIPLLRVPRIAPWVLLATALTHTAQAADVHSIEAVATFNNVGIEVRFATPPPPGASLLPRVRKRGSEAGFHDAHPLVPIAPSRYAGSLVALEAGTIYDIRLASDLFSGGVLEMTVRTRADAVRSANGRTLHVASSFGNDSNDGLTEETPLRSLAEALGRVRPGDTILLAGGGYLEGDLTVPVSGTEDRPIVIRSAPGQTAVLDGTDPDFEPHWELFDREAAVYRTPCSRQPTNAYLNGGQLFHYRSLDDLRARRWEQPGGYTVDDRFLYARFPHDDSPSEHRITIPRFTTGLTIARRSHIHIIALEFRYYGYGTYHRGIYLDGADSIRVDGCAFHHTGLGVALKRDADFNVIQNCSFTESPVDTWSWHAVKTGGIGYEAGGIGIYTSDSPNKGNVIRHNTFRHMFDAAGLYSASLKGPTTNLDFHDNLIEDCSDDGIETDGAGINVRIYRNTLRRFLTGISVAPAALGPTYVFRNLLTDWRPVDGFGGYPIKFNVRSALPTRWVFLYHNTCATAVPGQPGFLFKQYSTWSDIVSRNNIYAGTSRALESWSAENPVDFDWDALFAPRADAPIRWARELYESLQRFAAATGQEAHGLLADPRFRAPAQGDYTLRPDSPCIDRGIRIAGFTDTVVGAAPDMGALESPHGTNVIHTGPQVQTDAGDVDAEKGGPGP